MGFIKALVFKLYAWMQGHEGVVDAHHTKYTDAEVDAILAVHAALPSVHHTKYTDAEVDAILAVHAALPSVHHTKYTDAEAVTALRLADVYLKNTGDLCTGKLTISTDGKEDPGSGAFHLVEENDATRFRATTYSNTGWHSPYFVFTKARGSATTPLYPQNGDTLMGIIAGGWMEDINNWRYGALLEMKASDNWSAGSYCPTSMYFKTYVNNLQYTRLIILAGGEIGINTLTPTAKFDVNSDILRLRTAKTPATAGAAGNTGDICWDASYIYVCVAANTWKRSAIATW